MTAPLLLDLSHTSHTRARTGIQRVTRALWTALGDRAIAITHDPHRDAWRPLDSWERANLLASDATGKRGARWPLAAKLRGRLHRLGKRRAALLPESSGLVVPEVFSPAVARALPALFSSCPSPRVALFHDALALQLPEFTPSSTVARFPAYMIELLRFDGIAAVSEDSRSSLIDYWGWLGISKTPPVRTLTLGITSQPLRPAGETHPAPTAPALLSVGSLEGRKNHVALFQACEDLWSRGERFSLQVIGLAHSRTGAAALAQLRALQARGRSLRYDGAVSDARVDAAYAGCAFSVYPSLREGFGLPVLESLAHGKPCVCSAKGALGESAQGGGCLMLESVDAESLRTAIARLLHAPDEIAVLSAAARQRRFKTWNEYAAELLEWMPTLKKSR